MQHHLVNYFEYSFSKREVLFLIIITAVGLAFVSYIYYGTFWPVLLTPLVFIKGKTIYKDHMIEKRKRKLLMQFRDLLYSLSASVATGRHMGDAICDAYAQLEEIYGYNEPVMEELRSMKTLMKETNERDDLVLRDLGERSGLTDIKDFAEVYSACKITGGNMIAAINKGAEIIGEKIAIEADIKSMAAQKKLEGRIITLMPAFIIVFLMIMAPDYLNLLYSTLAGRIIMTAGLGATVGAYVMIERITDI